MKSTLLLLLTLALSLSILQAQQPAAGPSVLGEVATTWPGIDYQVTAIQRIAGDRLLVVVKLFATPQTPPDGIFIGINVTVPKNTSSLFQMADTGAYRPLPVSIDGAILTDDTSHQTYATLKPNPSGQQYLSSQVIATLHPGEAQAMTIQFPIPPPPPSNNGVVPKQTVSIQFPKAVGPITRIVIPPAPPAAPSTTSPGN
jgi:hypothetical protein